MKGKEGFNFTFFEWENKGVFENRNIIVKHRKGPLLSEREVLRPIHNNFEENSKLKSRPFTQRNYRMKSIDKPDFLDNLVSSSNRNEMIPRSKSFINSKIEQSIFRHLKMHPKIAKSGKLPQILRNVNRSDWTLDQNLPIIGRKFKRL
ncbi:unnamed protein product [Blepharisma stoltei]|uniref:Translocon at the inner envelope membrane of chloroplasts 214 n=1 Tax=Blepharisma stoltei TaxID=1481888 RepID=A0AAU9IPT3_9CILI|nr:unnamed protein product [Blepharisma stoltei]